MFCASAYKNGEDCEYSTFLQRDCAKTSQLRVLTLAPKTQPIGMQSVWPTEHVWDAATCGFSFTWRNTPEASSSKSIISLSGQEIRTLQIWTRCLVTTETWHNSISSVVEAIWLV